MCLGADGTAQWEVEIGSTNGDQEPYAMALTGEGGVVITGETKSEGQGD